ncbi:MAG: hypothetical protein MUP14_06635 [Dehalococcoidia bacterium]|nr:hypothetical protein [Dehalococcoidia bacterium]
MKTLIVAVAVGIAAFLWLRLLAPTPSWEEMGDGMVQTLNHASRFVIGKGETKVGPIVPAIPTVPAYEGPFQPGQEVEVTNTGGCLTVRIYPGFDGPSWTCLPDGTRLKIVLGPLYSDGIWWWAAERQGWVAQPYLSPAVAGQEEPLIAQGVAARYRPQDDRKSFAREP